MQTFRKMYRVYSSKDDGASLEDVTISCIIYNILAVLAYCPTHLIQSGYFVSSFALSFGAACVKRSWSYG